MGHIRPAGGAPSELKAAGENCLCPLKRTLVGPDNSLLGFHPCESCDGVLFAVIVDVFIIHLPLVIHLRLVMMSSTNVHGVTDPVLNPSSSCLYLC